MQDSPIYGNCDRKHHESPVIEVFPENVRTNPFSMLSDVIKDGGPVFFESPIASMGIYRLETHRTISGGFSSGLPLS